ncbi:MAG TPA: glycosyltransferase family 1 protein [Acidimicrobiales bacterium]
MTRPDPLRVGVNLLWLVPGVVGGSEEYTTRLLRGMAEAEGDDVHLTLFVLAPFVAAHPDVVASFPTVSIGLDGGRRPVRVAAEATWLAREARRRRIDLFHHAGGVVPPGPAIRRIPSLLTIHDLQPLDLPANFSLVKRRWLASMLPRSVRAARMVVTPSDHVSRRVRDRFGLPEGRVRTVPHGVAPVVPSDPAARVAARQRHGLAGRRFVLYPAVPYVHKDHATLLRAFAALADDRPDVDLVLTGGPGPEDPALVELGRRLGVADRVRRTGRIPEAELAALYDEASVVAVPSRFEGFGAPALEAMAHGAPVVVADTTALPEVVGSAGRTVAPGAVAAWEKALADVLDHPARAAAMADAGLRRAAEFGWDRAAGALRAAYVGAASIGEDGVR